jgi:hypothetical protein
MNSKSMMMRRAIAFAATCLALLVLAAPSARAETDRFEIQRIRAQLVRLDTATGQVWRAAHDGDGGWSELGSMPHDAAIESAPGRYVVRQLGSASTARKGAASKDFKLIRLDRASGRVWTIQPLAESEWQAIPDGR